MTIRPSSSIVSVRSIRASRASSAHWPRSSAPQTAVTHPSIRTGWTTDRELYLAHLNGEALQLGLFVVSTLAACVALVLG